ncbi:hypothetical protein B0H13DRAFT_1923355 [Mycena leptocephala]|nr:hypothetical protein B0H13DRAFT_1923355 [Mycena leptocephala]
MSTQTLNIATTSAVPSSSGTATKAKACQPVQLPPPLPGAGRQRNTGQVKRETLLGLYSSSQHRNEDELREKAWERMAKAYSIRHRARVKAQEETAEEARSRARQASQKYRRKHADRLAHRQRIVRMEAYQRKHGHRAWLERYEKLEAQRAGLVRRLGRMRRCVGTRKNFDVRTRLLLSGSGGSVTRHVGRARLVDRAADSKTLRAHSTLQTKNKYEDMWYGKRVPAEDPGLIPLKTRSRGLLGAGKKGGRRQCTTRGNGMGACRGETGNRGPGACLARPSALRELERCNRLRTIWVSLMERESISVERPCRGPETDNQSRSRNEDETYHVSQTPMRRPRKTTQARFVVAGLLGKGKGLKSRADEMGRRGLACTGRVNIGTLRRGVIEGEVAKMTSIIQGSWALSLSSLGTGADCGRRARRRGRSREAGEVAVGTGHSVVAAWEAEADHNACTQGRSYLAG